MIYREMWIKQITMYLAIYRNRLKDLERYTKENSKRIPPEDIRIIILKQIQELEDLIEIIHASSKLEQIKIAIGRLKKTGFWQVSHWITTAIIPIEIWFNFFKLITYIEFQNRLGEKRVDILLLQWVNE